jgi:hypothetical protein
MVQNNIHEEYRPSFQQANDAFAFRERLEWNSLLMADNRWKFRKMTNKSLGESPHLEDI